MKHHQLKVKYIFVILSLFTLISCNKEKSESLEKFFFPFDKFVTPKVYVYKIKGRDITKTEYYRFNTVNQLMSVEVYDEKFNPITLIIDKKSNDGIILYELQNVYNKKPHKVEVINPLIFPFHPEKEIDCTTINQMQKSNLTLKFKEYTSFKFENTKLDCVKFKSKVILNENVTHPMNSEIFYAENIGIVKEIISYNGTKTIKELSKIISEEDFRKLSQ